MTPLASIYQVIIGHWISGILTKLCAAEDSIENQLASRDAALAGWHFELLVHREFLAGAWPLIMMKSDIADLPPFAMDSSSPWCLVGQICT